MATRTETIKLYVGYYDRASDATGLDYWLTEGADLNEDQLSNSFADQAETKVKYPDSMSSEEFVTAIYENVFNRPPEDRGLTFWVTALEEEKIERPDMILAVMNGALGDDKSTLDNKIEVSDSFATSGLDDYNQSVAVMAPVTNDDATVTAANDQINIWANESNGFSLTVQEDDIVGTGAADMIEGAVESNTLASTYQSFDNIDGGEGDDVLTLRSTGTATATATANMKGVETLNLNQLNTGTFNFEGINVSDLNNVKIEGSQASSSNFNNMTKIFDLELAESATTGVFVGYKDSVVSGASDEMNLTLTSSGSSAGAAPTQSVGMNGIENVNVALGEGFQGLNLVDTSLNKVTLTGASSLALQATSTTTNATTIDATGTTGNITVNSNIFDNVAGTTLTAGSGVLTATGGVGADKITGGVSADTIDSGLGNDTVNAGAGNDTITTLGGNNTLNGEAGNDTITGGMNNDTIFGGAGNDTIGSGGGVNTITGGAGADTMTATSTTTFRYISQNDSSAAAGTADTIIGFTTGTDSINVTAAITGSAGATGVATTNFLRAAGSLTDNLSTYGVGAAAGVTNAYQDNVTNTLYIDLNQDNLYESGSDLVINLTTTVVAADIIV